MVLCDSYSISKKFMYLYILQFEAKFQCYDAHAYVTAKNKDEVCIADNEVLVLTYNKNKSKYGDSGYYNLEKLADEITQRSMFNKPTILLLNSIPEAVSTKEPNKKINLITALKNDFSIIKMSGNKLNTPK